MNRIVRNVLAVVAGLPIGGAVNMGLILLGPRLIPLPAGIDPTKAESLAAHIHLLEPRHFLFPFLAHALGTFVGAFAAYLIAGSHRSALALAAGGIFLAGGIAAVRMIPAPLWFDVTDLVVAYLPMAWSAAGLGHRLAGPGDPLE